MFRGFAWKGETFSVTLHVSIATPLQGSLRDACIFGVTLWFGQARRIARRIGFSLTQSTDKVSLKMALITLSLDRGRSVCFKCENRDGSSLNKLSVPLRTLLFLEDRTQRVELLEPLSTWFMASNNKNTRKSSEPHPRGSNPTGRGGDE